MISDMRVVQDHGWIQNADGTLSWGPTRFWIEALKDDEWRELTVTKINEFPRSDDPLLDDQLRTASNARMSLSS